LICKVRKCFDQDRYFFQLESKHAESDEGYSYFVVTVGYPCSLGVSGGGVSSAAAAEEVQEDGMVDEVSAVAAEEEEEEEENVMEEVAGGGGIPTPSMVPCDLNKRFWIRASNIRFNLCVYFKYMLYIFVKLLSPYNQPLISFVFVVITIHKESNMINLWRFCFRSVNTLASGLLGNRRVVLQQMVRLQKWATAQVVKIGVQNMMMAYIVQLLL
jgi:hypothetical protein